MLDFDEAKVTFRVAGVTYYLLPLSFDDVPTVGSAIASDEVKEQAELLVEVLAGKARCDIPAWRLRLGRKPSPDAAVRSLSVRQQARLFGEWLGEMRDVVPGESSGSAV